MTGLGFVDHLTLTIWQWGALLAAMGIIIRLPNWTGLVTAHALLFAAFFNTALLTDTRLLFHSAAYLQSFTRNSRIVIM